MGTTETHTNGHAKPVAVTDLVQTAVIAVYLVQKLGKPNRGEIQKLALDKLNCKLNARTLERALQGAARAGRNLISILQSRLPSEEGGAVVDVFSMKDPQRWKSPPEFAHIGTLLPRLLNTPELAEIKGWFDHQETSPKKDESKSQRGNDVDEYSNYSVLIYTKDTILGSQIHCPYTDFARKSAGYPVAQEVDKDAKPEMEGIFVVDELTGDRIIPSDVLNGWFVTNAGRYAGMQEARGGYVAFKPVRIPPRIKPIQLVLPVNNARQGAAAPKSYEAIPAGQILKIEFTAPNKGLFSSEQLEKLFHIAGNRPRRGLSPARGKRVGHFQVIGFKDHGPLKTSGIDYVLLDLPPALAKFASMGDRTEMGLGSPENELPLEPTEEHFRYLVNAVKRLDKVVLKPGAKATDDAPFPAPKEEESLE